MVAHADPNRDASRNGDGVQDILVSDLGSFPPTDRRCGSVVWLRGERDGSFTPFTLLDGVGRVADAQAADFRGVGKSQGEHGHMAGEVEDARAALGYLRERYPQLPFALAGFSFGSRAIMQLGCEVGGAQFLLAAGLATRLGPVDFLAAWQLSEQFFQAIQCGVDVDVAHHREHEIIRHEVFGRHVFYLRGRYFLDPIAIQKVQSPIAVGNVFR